MPLRKPIPIPSRFVPARMRGLGALGDAASILQLLAQAAAQFGLNPALVTAIARQESGLNPNAVSSAGAQGVMQLMPSTAAQLGVTNAFDPAQNINAGVKYLAQLLSQFGDIGEALAAYNWGPGNVSNALQQWGSDWLSHAPAETQNYVQSIAGITPQSYAAAAAPAPSVTQQPDITASATATSPPPLTIDAATGEVIDEAAGFPQPAAPMDPNTLLLTGIAVGAYVLYDLFFE